MVLLPQLFFMSNIYSSLSHLYEMMYQSFINYDEEYSYYSEILKNYNFNSIIELGCGTGSLASRFIKNGYNYSGLDVSDDMLGIARSKNHGSEFLSGDMTSFQLKDKKEACIIAGRTISYLLRNQELIDCFNSIYKNLKTDGIVCFDSIDAEKFIPTIRNGKRIMHDAEFENRKFQRESFWSVPESDNGAFNWKSVFYEEKRNGNLEKIGEDESVLRSFSKKEMCLFLEGCNFRIESIEDRPSYAFDTFVIVAQKNPDHGNV